MAERELVLVDGTTTIRALRKINPKGEDHLHKRIGDIRTSA
jgi:hypothetical protein